MSSISYLAGCDSAVLSHSCDPCPPGEHGRVRGVALVKKSVAFADITDEAEWATKILAGDVVIIPDTNGSFDGGTPKYGPGFGDTIQRYLGSDFKLNFKDPNYTADNCAMYNAVKKSNNWKVAWVSESKVYISTATASIVAKAPIADDINTEIYFEVECQFTQADAPCPADIPEGVFDCFEIVE